MTADTGDLLRRIRHRLFKGAGTLSTSNRFAHHVTLLALPPVTPFSGCPKNPSTVPP
jgi:hypothetical protein